MADALAPRQPLLSLPGFMPDALNFASRLALAMLLAYTFSFAVQLQSASSAGVCVAIVMQPTPGMAFSKAVYRVLGTVLGGVVGLLLVAAFPQDRTMLLLSFSLWLAACTFVASLLRDFRAYGAVLSGYTAAIIALFEIDAPGNSLFYALDRVAAILVGVVSVAAVNAVFVADTAHSSLMRALRERLDDARDAAVNALSCRAPLDEEAFMHRLTGIIGLRTDATYAATEFPDGRGRSQAATATIAALMVMAAASRLIGRVLPLAGPGGPAPTVRAYLDQVSEAIRLRRPVAEPTHLASDPLDALLIERAYLLGVEHQQAQAGLHAAMTGDGSTAPPPVRLSAHHDVVTAGTNALRTLGAVALGSAYCIFSGVPNSTLLLVQVAAFVALFGMQPNPIAPAIGFAIGLPLAAVYTGVIEFLILPNASGFVPFALVVGGAVFPIGLAMRHPATAPIGTGFLLFFAILLSPSNEQAFDLAGFLNEGVEIGTATLLMALTFFVVLPVVPGWRLLLLLHGAARTLKRTLRRPRGLVPAAAYSRNFDLVTQATAWTPHGRRARVAILSRIYAFAELDVALRRAWSCLHESAFSAPDFADAAAQARTALANPEPDTLDRTARSLLAHPAARTAPRHVSRLAADLYAAGRLLARQQAAFRHYGLARA